MYHTLHIFILIQVDLKSLLNKKIYNYSAKIWPKELN